MVRLFGYVLVSAVSACRVFGDILVSVLLYIDPCRYVYRFGYGGRHGTYRSRHYHASRYLCYRYVDSAKHSAYDNRTQRLNFKKWYRILTTLIAYPWYNLLCAVAITIGVLTPNLTWRPTVHDRPMSLTQIVGNQGVALAGADSGATAAAVSCVATGDSVVVAQDTASNLAVDEVCASKDTHIDK